MDTKTLVQYVLPALVTLIVGVLALSVPVRNQRQLLIQEIEAIERLKKLSRGDTVKRLEDVIDARVMTWKNRTTWWYRSVQVGKAGLAGSAVLVVLDILGFSTYAALKPKMLARVMPYEVNIARAGLGLLEFSGVFVVLGLTMQLLDKPDPPWWYRILRFILIYAVTASFVLLTSWGVGPLETWQP